MRGLQKDNIRNFLSLQNYDVRESRNARWIDQKCTPDVVTIVCDCILQYTENNYGEFTPENIRLAEYTVENVQAIFKKPKTTEEKAINEYDKFFGQPMKMLAYAGVLSEKKKRKRNFYTILDFDMLRYLSLRERNSLTFLQMYISKVLSDSGIKHLFDKLFDKQTKKSYDDSKSGLTNFLLSHTKIGDRGSDGKYETGRIFSKIVNPLAFELNKRGTKNGRISKHRITYDMLMYNRDNFRDVYADKPKELTRRQYAEQIKFAPSSRLNVYMSQKAKRILRQFNDDFRGGMSEIEDGKHNSDRATHIHHIFPEAEFPEICAHYENLIALTPTQHLNYAHPLNHTSKICREYQHICLLAKAENIRESLENSDVIYEFGNFLFVLFVGLDNDFFMQISDGGFDEAVTAINLAYQE